MVYRFRVASASMLDPRLASQLDAVARSATGAPRRVALAVACRAHEIGVPPAASRRWLVAHGPAPLAVYASDPRRWHRTATVAARHVASNSSAGAAANMRLAAARRLVGRLLSPPVIGSSERKASPSPAWVAARSTFAAVALGALDGAERDPAHDTVLVSRASLAVELGAGRATVSRHLAMLVDAGWLRERQRRPGGCSVFALPRLSTEAGAVAWEHDWLVEALAQPAGTTPADPVTAGALAAIRSVAHPAWRYGGLPAAAWLVVCAGRCGLDARTLGVSARRTREAIGSLEAAVLDTPDVDLPPALDRLAATSGAAGRAAEARSRRAAEIAARRVSLEAARDVRRRVAVALGQAGTTPRTSASAARRERWLEGLRPVVERCPAEHRRALRAGLVARLRRGGWDQRVAGQVAVSAGLGD